MAQGPIKKPKAVPSRRPQSIGPQKRGNGATIAPKKATKATLAKQQKMTKKLSAGLINRTERSLAQRAGHLELLAGGKKEAKEKAKARAGGGSGKKN